jgi:hypothetical protein
MTRDKAVIQLRLYNGNIGAVLESHFASQEISTSSAMPSGAADALIPVSRKN